MHGQVLSQKLWTNTVCIDLMPGLAHYSLHLNKVQAMLKLHLCLNNVVNPSLCRERGEPVPPHMANTVARAIKERHCTAVSDAAKVSHLHSPMFLVSGVWSHNSGAFAQLQE